MSSSYRQHCDACGGVGWRIGPTAAVRCGECNGEGSKLRRSYDTGIGLDTAEDHEIAELRGALRRVLQATTEGLTLRNHESALGAVMSIATAALEGRSA